LKESKTIINNCIFLTILSVVGVIFVLLSASLFGAGISSDSVKYIAIARNILSGQGYCNYDGDLVPSFPPLFPVTLAFLGLFGADPFDMVLFFNAIAFGLIIFFSGHLFFNYFKSKILATLGAISILLSIPLFFVSKMIWSEPFFILLVILFITYFLKLLLETANRIGLLLLVSILASLACLQRYIGITLILTGIILIFFFYLILIY